jgi:hypothetical protein
MQAENPHQQQRFCAPPNFFIGQFLLPSQIAPLAITAGGNLPPKQPYNKDFNQMKNGNNTCHGIIHQSKKDEFVEKSEGTKSPPIRLRTQHNRRKPRVLFTQEQVDLGLMPIYG